LRRSPMRNPEADPVMPAAVQPEYYSLGSDMLDNQCGPSTARGTPANLEAAAAEQSQWEAVAAVPDTSQLYAGLLLPSDNVLLSSMSNTALLDASTLTLEASLELPRWDESDLFIGLAFEGSAGIVMG
jgi:hypothetical protein